MRRRGDGGRTSGGGRGRKWLWRLHVALYVFQFRVTPLRALLSHPSEAELVVHIVPYTSLESHLLPDLIRITADAGEDDEKLVGNLGRLEGITTSQRLEKQKDSGGDVEVEFSKVYKLLFNLLDELDHNVNRRFIWSEVHFFMKWFFKLKKHDKDRVFRVIKDGQLEFVGGMMTEFDEGVSSYEDFMINVEQGNEILFQTFGVKVKHAWQINSLGGHSERIASLFTDLGYQTITISQIHYLVKNQFKASQHLEFLWETKNLNENANRNSNREFDENSNRNFEDQFNEHVYEKSSKSFDENSGMILTHVLEGSGEIVEGYDFEKAGVRQVSNAARRADRLVRHCREKSAFYRTNHLMLPFGGSFKFIEASKQFNNLEKLMRQVNEKVSDIEIKFSTLSEYFAAVKQNLAITSVKLPTYRGDFFPYAETASKYFVGLYANRPALRRDAFHLKNMVRSAETFFALARTRYKALSASSKILEIEKIVDGKIIAGAVGSDRKVDENQLWGKYLFDVLQNGRTTLALINEHSISTGVLSPRAQAYFMNKIDLMTEELPTIILESLEVMLTKRDIELQVGATTARKFKPELSFLPFSLNSDDSLYSVQHPMIFHNPLLTPRREIYHFELPSKLSLGQLRQLQVQDVNGDDVLSQVYQEIQPDAEFTSGKSYKRVNMISFLIEVPPLGINTYFLFAASARSRLNRFGVESQLGNRFTMNSVFEIEAGELIKTTRLRSQKELEIESLRPQDVVSESGIQEATTYLPVISIETSLLKLELQADTGLLRSIEDKRNRRKTLVKQRFLQFLDSAPEEKVFAPQRSAQDLEFGKRLTISVVDGPLVKQVTVLSHPTNDNPNFFSQTFRLYSALKLKEGGIPDFPFDVIDLSLTLHASRPNSDVLLRFETSMSSTGVFYTDDATNSLVERKSYEDTPVASNFYPTVNTIALRDKEMTPVSREGQLLQIATQLPTAVSSLIEENGGGYSSNIDMLLARTLSSNGQEARSTASNTGLRDQGFRSDRREAAVNAIRQDMELNTGHSFSFSLSVGTPSSVLQHRTELLARLKHPLFAVFALENQNMEEILNRQSWLSRFVGQTSYLNERYLPQKAETERYLSPSPVELPYLDSFRIKDQFSDEIFLRVRNTVTTVGMEASLSQRQMRVIDFAQLFDTEHKIYGLRSLKSPRHSSGTAVGVNAVEAEMEEKGVYRLSAGEALTFSVDMICLPDKELPLPGTDNGVEKQSDSGTRDPHATRVDSVSPGSDTMQPVGKPVLTGSEAEEMGFEKPPEELKLELLSTIDKDESLLKVLEKRVKRARTNIEELNEEFKLIANTDDKAAKEEAMKHIQKAEVTLQEATTELVERMKHLKETQQKLDMLTFRLETLGLQTGASPLSHFSSFGTTGAQGGDRLRYGFGTSYGRQMREWEATLHGIITGAGGMLVLVLLYNLMCVKLDKLPRVPIKWVGFSEQDKDMELPLRKQN